MGASARPSGLSRLLVAFAIVVTVNACEPEPLRPTNYSPIDLGLSALTMLSKPDRASDFRPRDDLPVWDASLPIDWAADPFGDRNWQFRLHSWHSMDYALYEYGDTGNATWLQRAAEVALDWGRFHVDLNKRSPFEWYDHSAAIRAARLAYLLDNILAGRVDISETKLAALMHLADLHAKKLQDPKFLATGNHAIFQLAGLDALCEVVHWRRSCEAGRWFARSEFAELIQTQFTLEGVHTERSPSYHRGVLRTLGRLDAAHRFASSGVGEIVELAQEVTPWLTWPDGEFVALGDSTGMGRALESPVEPTCLNNSCWAVRDLTDSGYAIIRSLPEKPRAEASMLFVAGTGSLSGHKHADELSFLLMEGGRKIFVDSGCYGYNRDEARGYVMSARGHNVPSLADHEIGPWHVDVGAGKFGPIRVVGTEFLVDGSVERRRRFRGRYFRHGRTFRYAPGVSLTIEDRLINHTRSPWVSNLHLAPELVPVVEGTGFSVHVGERLVRVEFEGEGCELSVTKGATEPYQGWVTVGYQKLEPAPVVSASCPADLVVSEWRMDLDAT